MSSLLDKISELEQQIVELKAEAEKVDALKYWHDTNTECGVTHIPSSLLLRAIEALQKVGEQER